MEEEPLRVRIPRRGEILAVVEQVLGCNKLRVKCMDNKIRLCRIPGKMIGKYKRKLWVRKDSLILIEPWQVQSDEKCDMIYKYNRTQSNWLIKKGMLKFGDDIEST